MICVTGANGTLSSEVIRQLESAKAPLRAAYFSSKQAEAARVRGIEAGIIDYNSFMQNALTFMAKTIRAESVFYSASGQAKISHVDVRDIAAVAVKALIAPDHEGRTYTLSGPEALTYDDLANELSKVLGRRISHINLSPADLRNGMLAEGMPEEIADRMLDLERYFCENRASHITNDVKQVTGRDPRRFAHYVRDTAATGVWDVEAE